MARRPERRSRAPRGQPAAASSKNRRETKDRQETDVVEAFMGLAADRDFRDIGLADIAEAAGLSLGQLRARYDGRFALLAEFSRRVDAAVLDREVTEGEEPRDRLFEIAMHRFDALLPYRPALRRIARSARRDLVLARVLHRITLRSQMWMLAAADVRRRGIIGRITLEGMVFAYADVFRTFLDDEDEGLARTMAALDRMLGRGEQWLGWIDRACAFLPDFRGRSGGRQDAAGAGS
jgi:AcrR family transcriptional regulator